MRILLGLIGGSLLAYLFHDRTMSYEDKRKKGLFRHRNFSAGFRLKKGVPMETFKAGDRVMTGKGRFDTVVSVPGMKEYDSEGFYSAKYGFVLAINGWQPQRNWRKMDTVSQYDTMKFRIENLQNGWDKDADDILAEIRPYMDKDYLLFIPFCSHGHIYIHDTQDKKDVQAESWASFYYDTQCEKMSAFKRALLWLLDHSSIKKDEKQEKIKELEGKVRELQEEIAKLK